MALTLAGAVFAVDNNTALTQKGTAITAQGFGASQCDHQPLPGAGEVAWHFIFNGDPGTVNGHFAFSDGDQDLVSEDQGANQTWWIITDASVTLDGSATYTDGTGGNFNLSHTCYGEATSTTPPAETPTPTPTLPQTNTIGQTSGNGPGTSLTVVFALILAIAGGLVAYAMRPRRVGNR